MYDFAIIALLALATLKLVDFLTDAVPQLRNLRTLATFVIGVGATALADHVAHFRPFGELDLKIVAREDLCVADSAVGGFDELVQIPPQSRWRQRTDIEEFVHVAAEQGEHPQLGRKLEIRHGSRYDQYRCDGRHGARNLQCRMVLMTTQGMEVGLQEYDRGLHVSLR